MPEPDPPSALRTERLTLRPFAIEDAPEVARLANDPHVLDVLVELPKPYRVEHARAWIETQEPARRRGARHTFAVCEGEGSTPVGAATLHRATPCTGRGALGYWTGREGRGRGLTTEAVRALVAFGTDALGLHRIEARHLARNPASGRVLEKAGLVREATLAGYFRNPRTGEIEDMVQWATPAASAARRVAPRRPAAPDRTAPASRAPTIATVSLLVHDYDAARDGFVDGLGFRVVEDVALDEPGGDGRPKRWLVVAPPGGGARLLLARASTDAERAAVGRQGGGRVWLFLETDDLERDRARMLAAGIVFEEAPRREPYGTVAVFRDPCGNRWDLIEPRRG